MPHVFTLEGANFPEVGQPLAPHATIIGPTRVATEVYGPGGTPTLHRRRFPARGPVCDYCDPDYFTVMNGGQPMIPYRPQQFGGADDFLSRQSPLVAGSIVIGGALTVGAVLATVGVWLYYKAGYKPKRAAQGWGGWNWG